MHRLSVPVQPKGAHWGRGQGSVVLPTLANHVLMCALCTRALSG